jgi:hypothetical protein
MNEYPTTIKINILTSIGSMGSRFEEAQKIYDAACMNIGVQEAKAALRKAAEEWAAAMRKALTDVNNTNVAINIDLRFGAHFD